MDGLPSKSFVNMYKETMPYTPTAAAAGLARHLPAILSLSTCLSPRVAQMLPLSRAGLRLRQVAMPQRTIY